LRELMHQQTTGERAGYGGGGVTALQNVLANVGRELANLRRRQIRQTNAQREHRRQRVRSGAVTVGLIGYTNAGKSSLFRLLSGKKVLVEDQLFSTLETTVGRMEDSPRVLLADTIGFIDNIPNATLSAFKATLAEALEADLTLVLADASDSPLELERKLLTTRREVFERLYGEPVDDEFPWNDAMDPYHHSMQVVLTKIDQADEHMLDEAHATVAGLGFPPALGISAHSGVGIDTLKGAILRHLFGSPSTVHVHPSMDNAGDAVERIVSDIYDQGMVTSNERDPNGTVSLTVWLTHAALEKLKARWNERIEVK
jgi:GTP-binding protein HflX